MAYTLLAEPHKALQGAHHFSDITGLASHLTRPRINGINK
ncbi:hypothetical protein PIIN_10984 [Serendipita indica DSM 11827]|uniref:Uncharacterized protein n=1 Tax=Serendipita indica (strain DSM 11827) TaxID=1109443 RepID=G4U0A6_SERID|nr:hypothetical protein PIIN_10984 [Serendipita indica DSM 11827]